MMGVRKNWQAHTYTQLPLCFIQLNYYDYTRLTFIVEVFCDHFVALRIPFQ